MKIITLQWEYEDELPEMADEEFDEIYGSSVVEGVRLYPFVEINGERYYVSGIKYSESEE